MRLPGQLPLEQAQVAELARLRVLVQELVQMQAQLLVSEPELELAQVQAQRLVQKLELELALGLQLEREPPVVWVPEPPLVLTQGREPARQQELTAVLERVRKLRVSRQMELQQHRLPTAAQEQLPYLPALPMKAPCWGAPAW